MSSSRIAARSRAGLCVLATTLSVLGAIAVHAQGLGLKPGLWEAHITRQLVDGLDMTALVAQAQTTLANLSPEQRAAAQSLMANAGVSQGANGNFRLCVTAQMAQRSLPILDKDGRCQPSKMTRQGNQVRFEFSCTIEGVSTQGQGQASITPESISTHVDVTATSSIGTHKLQTDTVIARIGADCGNVKPPPGFGG